MSMGRASQHWPRSSTADFTKPNAQAPHLRRQLPDLLSGTRGARKKTRSSSRLGSTESQSTLGFTTQFTNQDVLGATGQFKPVQEHYSNMIGSRSMMLPNPFQLEKTTHWPSTPAPQLGTQLPLTAAPIQPQFLTEIDQYVEQELFELQTNGQHDPLALSESRLEIYSHAFEMFISRLTTYQPLLSAIHKEYNTLIKQLQYKVNSFEATKSELGTLKERTVLLVNKIKADYTRRLMALQSELQGKEEKARSMYSENRRVLHEAELSKKLEVEAKQFAVDNHDAAKLLADVITLKEQEIKGQLDAVKRAEELMAEKKMLEEKCQRLMEEVESSVQAHEHEKLQQQYTNMKNHNEELLRQLKKVNEDYAETTEAMQRQAQNWQARNSHKGNQGNDAADQTPRPDIKALSSNLGAREYPVPVIEISTASTAEVVGVLFGEIDRLSAQVAGCEAPAIQAAPNASVPYLKAVDVVPKQLSQDDLDQIAEQFLLEHAQLQLESHSQRRVSKSFADFMQARYGEECDAYSAGVCSLLLSGGGQLSRSSAALLAGLQQDVQQPLSIDVLKVHITKESVCDVSHMDGSDVAQVEESDTPA